MSNHCRQPTEKLARYALKGVVILLIFLEVHMGTNQNTLRQGQKERLRKGVIQGSRYYNRFLKDKTFIIVTVDYMYCSITFKKQDFCHFTGLSISHVSESNFFDICVNGTITNSNIRDEQHYDYNTLRVKNNILKKLNKFLHADASTNLFISGLVTNTFTFSCAIRNDIENMTICFVGENNHARSLRKARNSRNTEDEKQIIGIFELNNSKWDKCIYIRNKQDIIDNISQDKFSNGLKKYLHID